MSNLSVCFLVFYTVTVVAACPITNCASCLETTCDKCRNGYYPSRDGTACFRCQTGCTECPSWSECTACHTGKWGSYCQNDCNGCKDGNSYCSKSGCDRGCKDGYYGDTCRCTQCPEHCTKCDSSTSCSQCESGYWGSYCQNSCYMCKDGSSYCSKSGCGHGCKDGYYVGTDDRCNTRCPMYCTKCDNSTSCTECVAGKWGSYCQNSCSVCKDGYTYAACVKSGCDHGCIVGYYEATDSCTRCPTYCTLCDRLSCTACVAGRWGTYCQNSCVGCKDGSSYCSISGCDHGCEDRYYGGTDGRCTRCPSYCTKCDNATSCTECRAGAWGSYCQNSCSVCKDYGNIYSHWLGIPRGRRCQRT